MRIRYNGQYKYIFEVEQLVTSESYRTSETYIYYSHPGFEAGTKIDPYQNHYPHEAPSTIILLGTVVGRFNGRLNDGPTLLSYQLEVTVYSASTRSQVTFLVRIYLKNTYLEVLC